MMKRFSSEIRNWPIHGKDHLNLTYVETNGLDLEDFISNAMITLEDWHGNEGPDWELGDLPSKDYDMVVQLFVEHLAGA